jgi:hypothetical protein
MTSGRIADYSKRAPVTTRTLQAVTCLALLAGLAAADPPPGAEAQARQAALDFVRAYNARDLDRACALSSAPLLYDFTAVFKTPDEVKDHLRLCLRRSAKSPFTEEARSATRYDDFRAKIQDKHRRWLDQVLGREDLVVAVKSAAEPKFNVYLFVRVKDKVAHVAGWAAD